MARLTILIAFVLVSYLSVAQQGKAATTTPVLGSSVALPIVFTKTIRADRTHAGDVVTAKTSQSIRLADGEIVPAGAQVTGHVIKAEAFVYDKTPYAVQKRSMLSLHFDSLQIDKKVLPLEITVRAMADPITSWGAREPKSTDLDSQGTVTQIGGDQLVPSQSEVVSPKGDVVAYNRHGGVYARLIASGDCDASSAEVSVGIYSPSACGLYGFTNVSAIEKGTATNPSVLTLVSSRISPMVWKNSTALLEVLPVRKAVAVR